MTAKPGAGSRNKGYRAEAELVKWLRLRGYTSAHRRMIGERGFDIWGVDRGHGEVAIEVKSAEKWLLNAWLKQAEEQAKDGQEWVLVIRVAGLPAPAYWLTISPTTQAWQGGNATFTVGSFSALQHVWPHVATYNKAMQVEAADSPGLIAMTAGWWL